MSVALPISSYRILACRDTLAAGLAVQPAGLFPEHPSGTVVTTGLPAGISVSVMAGLPAIVTPLRCTGIDSLHDLAVARAWADGAYDIVVSLHPALDGPELGLVTANADYSADHGLAEILVGAAMRGRLATWSWRNMHNAPAIRRLAHAAKDASLGADGSRIGPPPRADIKQPAMHRNSGRWVIRLGTCSKAGGQRKRRPYSPPATVRQRACIAALQYASGLKRPEIPARLTMRGASDLIDRLRNAP